VLVPVQPNDATLNNFSAFFFFSYFVMSTWVKTKVLFQCLCTPWQIVGL